MAHRLLGHCAAKELLEIFVGATAAKSGFQIDFHVVEEAGAKMTIRSNPQAIAHVTKMFRQRSDNPNSSQRAWNLKKPGYA